MDLISELETLKADYSAALALIEEAKLNHEAAKAEKATLEAAFQAAKAEFDKAKAESAELAEKLGEALKSIDSLKAEAKTATEKAIDIAASQGIAPMKSESPVATYGKDNILAEFASIKDPVKRGEFWKSNRKALLDV